MFDILRDSISGDLQKDVARMDADERSGFLAWAFKQFAWFFISLATGGLVIALLLSIGG